MVNWSTKDPIGTPARLEKILEHLQERAVREGIPFEVVALKVRRKARAKLEPEEAT
jgi:hypothetical protein